MMRKYVGVSLVVAGFSLSGPSFAGGTAPDTDSHAAKAGAHGSSHWGYSGAEGPEHWGDLNPKYVACSTGKNQTPIDITGMVEAELPEITINYQPNGGNEILNNGHTIQVNYAAGSSITVDGSEFELKQFHFHTPSENLVNGSHYPMEAHFVHADKDNNLAVIALMYEEGEANAELEKAFSNIPQKVDQKDALADAVSADDLLPANRDYYRFTGSLTTPPCSEGVRWLVIKEASHAAKEQIEAFSHTMHHPNNRPVQATNARVILQ